MKKLAMRAVSSLSILALFLCLLQKPVPTKAHAEEAKTPSVTASSITSYAFSAHPGDSLSRLVRRALQLRAVTDQPTALYCENIISTELGGEYIEIDQQVVVTYEQMDRCVAAAKNLTQEQRAAWQAYANTVTFDLDDINPTNNSTNVVPAPPAETKEETAPTPETNTDTEPNPEASMNQDQEESKTTEPAKPEEQFNNYLWYIPVATLAIMLFVLSGLLTTSRPRR